MQICTRCGGVKRAGMRHTVPAPKKPTTMTAAERQAVAVGWNLASYRKAVRKAVAKRRVEAQRTKRAMNPPDPYRLALEKRRGEPQPPEATPGPTMRPGPPRLPSNPPTEVQRDEGAYEAPDGYAIAIEKRQKEAR